jgi:hypothetical protein
MNHILTIPFTLDAAELAQKMKIRGSLFEEFEGLVAQAAAVACPKVLWREAYVETLSDGTATIDGVLFQSDVLRHNLTGIGRVFAYVATCGREVDGLLAGKNDFVLSAWLHFIKLELLTFCLPALRGVIRQQFGMERLSAMNPGSGDEDVWTIDQQVGLFSLFGDVEAQVGVRLTESYLMVPDVSVSGILFAADRAYQNCQLCRREHCPNRSAPFDAVLWAEVQAKAH